MRNRYRLTHSKQHLADHFQAVGDGVEDRPRYNVAPTQQVLTVRKEQGKKVRQFTTMRWGLIPSWAKDMSIGNRTLNAPEPFMAINPTPCATEDRFLRPMCEAPLRLDSSWQAPAERMIAQASSQRGGVLLPRR